MEEKKKTAREIIEGYDGPPVRIMEVCGTHTHEIFRLGIRKLLPEQVELISGPGCPVCVTQVGFIDEAIYLALERQVTICTFGDLVRVPGTNMSLAGARERGAKIRIVYSPVDAKEYAKEHPKEQVTFLSVGFETTTPSACLSVKKAREEGLTNYSILTANKTMPQAYEALKESADIFLWASILCYPRVVTENGSPQAQKLVEEMMEPCDSEWRGLGVIKGSGMRLQEEWSAFDARKKYKIPLIQGKANPACRCGDVLQGKCKPSDCKVFGKVCTPQHPIGACMVSGEGACSAYYMYGEAEKMK